MTIRINCRALSERVLVVKWGVCSTNVKSIIVDGKGRLLLSRQTKMPQVPVSKMSLLCGVALVNLSLQYKQDGNPYNGPSAIMVKVKPIRQDGQDGPVGQDGQNEPVGQDWQNGPVGQDRQNGPVGQDEQDGPVGQDCYPQDIN